MKSFDCLPIAALVQGQLFCIHGCISPEIRHIREVTDIYRTTEPPTKGKTTGSPPFAYDCFSFRSFM
jgi:serine/threonine-protein phosphatase 2B catalytic subunit